MILEAIIGTIFGTILGTIFGAILYPSASNTLGYRTNMIQRLTIIGVGLLGGSIGLASRRRISDVKIMGCGHREASLERAQDVGAIDEWTLDPADAVRDADLVVVCTPVGQVGPWLAKIADHLKPGAIVTDVGSTKSAIVTAGERVIRRPAFFVGSHPMAGSEKRGVEVARAELFEGATCVVTRTDATDEAAATIVEDFWDTLGARVVRHTPAEHDRLVALVSHVPHAVAGALMGIQTDASLDLHGRGLLDTTRVAGGDADLWRDILIDNSANVIDGIDAVVAQLMQLRGLLNSQNATVVREWLQTHATARQALEMGRG